MCMFIIILVYIEKFFFFYVRVWSGVKYTPNNCDKNLDIAQEELLIA